MYPPYFFFQKDKCHKCHTTRWFPYDRYDMGQASDSKLHTLFFPMKFINQSRMENKTMKDKENKRQDSEENQEFEFGGSGGFSIFNDSYPLFMAYDLTRNLPEEPLPEEEETEKPSISEDSPEDLQANERLKILKQFKSYSTKIKPPME